MEGEALEPRQLRAHDPVARHVSAFFHGIPQRIPDFYEQVRPGEWDVVQICDWLIEQFERSVGLVRPAGPRLLRH